MSAHALAHPAATLAKAAKPHLDGVWKWGITAALAAGAIGLAPVTVLLATGPRGERPGPRPSGGTR